MFGDNLLVGLFTALPGEALLSEAEDLIGDLLPNNDSSTWLFLLIVRYLNTPVTIRETQVSQHLQRSRLAFQARNTHVERTDLMLP